MEELIKVTTQSNGNQVVSARHLHSFLEVATDFKDWMPRMLEYGFEEGKDFSTFLSESTGGRPSKEYIISLDTAKEISMIQRTDKGRQARKYFIECERIIKENIIKPRTHLEVLDSERALLLQNIEFEKQLEEQRNKIEQDKPKVVFAESVIGSSNSILIRQFAKDLCDDNFEIGQNRLFEWFRENKYLNDQNEPFQQFVSQGLFEVITRAIGSGTETFTSKTTKITGKGSVYFANKIKSILL